MLKLIKIINLIFCDFVHELCERKKGEKETDRQRKREMEGKKIYIIKKAEERSISLVVDGRTHTTSSLSTFNVIVCVP